MSEDMVRLIIQASISAVFLIAGFAVLLLEVGDPTLQKLAAGWVGAVLGFWLQ
jgi:hypothetical protein